MDALSLSGAPIRFGEIHGPFLSVQPKSDVRVDRRRFRPVTSEIANRRGRRNFFINIS